MTRTLRFNAAAFTLATVLYYTRLRAHGLDGPLWFELSPEQKAHYVTRAESILDSMAIADVLPFPARTHALEATQ